MPDVSVGTFIFSHLQSILEGFNFQLVKEEQPSLVDQPPDRFLSLADTRRVVWEDKAWKVFEAHAPEILELAKSAEGRSLTFRGVEEHGRAILYMLSLAMFDTKCHWSLLFGGNNSLFFQRVPSANATRYGLICSDVTSLGDLFLVVLGMLLVPGNASLVDLATFKIPVPPTSPPCDNQISTRQNLQQIQEETEGSSTSITEFSDITDSEHVTLNFRLAGYEHKDITLDQRRTSAAFVSAYIETPPDSAPPRTPSYLATFATNYFEKKPAVRPSPPRAVVPMLNVAECIMPGATGVVFRATLGPMPLVIKAIPPGWKGVDDLLNEAVVYETLASLQGIALPRSAGLFDGHGWLIIILEDVGRPVTVVSDLSLHQREKLWQQACSIHASGVLHHDLELRNLVTSSSGEVRIVDYAYARLGHQCDASTCVELKRFRGLLDNHLSP